MKGMQMELFADVEEHAAAVAMEVDDCDPLDMFGEGVIGSETKLADTDFFNSFQDDFDDFDIY